MARSFIAVAFAAVMLSGCATIIKGTSQSINITTPPTTGATCTLTSSEGNWQLVSPASVIVEKSKNDLSARCTKAGWQDATAIIPSDLEAWTAGNLLFSPIVGTGVDMATGAIHEYPNTFAIPMTPNGPAQK